MNWIDEIEERVGKLEELMSTVGKPEELMSTNESLRCRADRAEFHSRLDALQKGLHDVRHWLHEHVNAPQAGPPHRTRNSAAIWIWPEDGGGYRASRKHPNEVPLGEDLVWLSSCMLTHLHIEPLSVSPSGEPTLFYVTVTRATQ